MKLLLLSNFTDIENEHYLLNLLFCEGLECYHLRKLYYTKEQMVSYIEQIPVPFRQYVVLHSHFELIAEYGLKGGHFTKKYSYDHYKKEVNEANTFTHLGFSLHSIQELKKIHSDYTYVFLSPVFDSISNRGYNSKIRLNDLKQLLNKQLNRPEVIALGGISDKVIEKVFETEFDGIALLGYIWTYFEQEQNLIATVNRFRHIKALMKQEAQKKLLVECV